MTDTREESSTPSKRELAAEIEKLSRELGIETTTAGKNRAALLEMLEELRTQVAPAPPTGDSAAPASPPTDASTASTQPPPDPGPKALSALDLELERMIDEGGHDLVSNLRGVLEDHDFDGADLADPFACIQLAGMIGLLRGVAPALATRAPLVAQELRHRADDLAKLLPAGMPTGDLAGRDFAVAPGRSITSKRGILGPGEHVRPEDVSGGVERLGELASRGVLVTR